MAEEPEVDWPRFTLVTYRAPTGIPNGWAAELLEKGAPDGLVSTAARELTLLEHPKAGALVCFGTTGPPMTTSASIHAPNGSCSCRTGYSESATRGPNSQGLRILSTRVSTNASRRSAP
jgi:hypothetical protein